MPSVQICSMTWLEDHRHLNPLHWQHELLYIMFDYRIHSCVQSYGMKRVKNAIISRKLFERKSFKSPKLTISAGTYICTQFKVMKNNNFEITCECFELYISVGVVDFLVLTHLLPTVDVSTLFCEATEMSLHPWEKQCTTERDPSIKSDKISNKSKF